MKDHPRKSGSSPLDPVSAYCHDIRDTGKLSPDRERELAARIRAGDRRALNELVQANLKFVVAVCRQYENRGLPLADLISEGNLGLIRAAERFDSHQDCRFISYAVWWIRQAILTALADQSRSVRITTSTAMRLHRLTKAAQKLSQRLGREPSVEELELETGMHAGRIRTYLMLLAAEARLDAEGYELGETAQGTESSADSFHGKRVLDNLLLGLDDRERAVLDLYYGLKHGESANLMQMARVLGLSKERVRQIKEKAVAKLKALFLRNSKYPCTPTGKIPAADKP